MIRQIMPWQATAPGDVTILRAPGRRLTKLIAEAGVVGYDRVAAFEVEAVRVDDVDDLAALLDDLVGQPDRCIIRGALRPEFMGRPMVLRRSRARPGVPARFDEVPRIWIMVDVDGLPCPPGIDPTDPVRVGGGLRRFLPAPFWSARCAVQLSCSAGLKAGLRAHLWFMLDRPLARAELKRWLEPVPGVDLSVFRTIQVHYIASPIFIGVADPCVDGRLAVLSGFPAVAVPDLPEPVRPQPAPAAARSYAPPPRGGCFRSTRSEAYMLACLRAVARAPVGRRHPTFVGVAARLFGLAKAGSLDPADVAGRIKGAVNLSTFDRDLSEVDSALRWAWEHSTPWRLP